MFRIGIFAKFWKPGAVKTRLAKSIGAEPAADLYRQFIEALVDRFGDVSAERVLAHWPREKREAFAAIAGNRWRLAAQSPGDLGDRMTSFFQTAFAAGASPVALIGSDSPNLPLDIFEQARQALQDVDIVLGPTYDGGYYLIGTNHFVPEIFRGIPWSSARVHRATIEIASRMGLSCRDLPMWYDVDDRNDLLRIQSDLSKQISCSASLARLRQSIERVIAGAGAS